MIGTPRRLLGRDDSTTDVFDGSETVDGDPEGWSLGKPRHLDGPGIVGALERVALYNRALGAEEAQRLRDVLGCVDKRLSPGEFEEDSPAFSVT